MKPITQHGVNSLKSLISDIVRRGATPNGVKSMVKTAIEGNEDLKYALNIMYDPLVKFNIKISFEDYNLEAYEDVIECPENIDRLNLILEALCEKTVTKRNIKRTLVWDYIDQCSPLIVLFIRKSLDLGFGISSAKELGIIGSHSPQKGVLLKDPLHLSYPTIAEVKYNGSRLSVSVDEEGKVICKLLRGQVIHIPMLETLFSARGVLKGKTFDGELVYTGNTSNYPFNASSYILGGLTEADRIEVSGRITSATSMKQPLLMDGLMFIMYDVLKTSEFNQAKGTRVPYSTRRERLIEASNILLQGGDVSKALVNIATAWTIDTKEQLSRLLAWCTEIGSEGVMIKSPSSTYDYKKNNQWHKLKTMQECDLEIIGYEVHSRNSSWIGSLVCTGTIEGRAIKVNVGSGLNDTDRPIALMEHYLGKVVMVTYMDVVSNAKTDTYSLSNPRIVKDRTERKLLEVLRIDSNSVNY